MAIDGLGDLKLGEEFTNINPDELTPELQGVYKNMQSHFTKRTQEAVDAKKIAEDAKTKYDSGVSVLANEKVALEQQLEELKTSNTQLQTSLNTQPTGDGDDDILKFLDGLDGSDGGTGDRSAEDVRLINTLTNTVKDLNTKFIALEASTDEKTSKALKVIQYEHDLNNVSDLHQETYEEKLDKQALIDFAIEKQKPDLNEAYEMFTRERLIDKKAGERADVMLKEHLEKDESFNSGFSSESPVLFARDEKTPKTFTAATASILKEVRSKVE